jgi:hypothetical protein
LICNLQSFGNNSNDLPWRQQSTALQEFVFVHGLYRAINATQENTNSLNAEQGLRQYHEFLQDYE